MLFLKNNLAGLLSNTISNSASNAINKFEKIIGGKEPETTEKDSLCSFQMKILLKL